MNWLIPEASFAEHALVVVVALGVTALVVSIHYAGVNWLARRYLESKTKSGRARRTMLKIIFTLIGLHIVEIWCYGMAFWTLSVVPGTGYLHGEHGTNTMFDAVYLSATTYSTVGYGDLAPVGAIRVISGLESLTGLLLITWSASFTYLKMSRLWSRSDT